MATRIVEGLDDVKRALGEVPKETRKVLREAVAVTTRILGFRTKGAAPVDTGNLRDSIVAVPPRGVSLNGSVQIKTLTTIRHEDRDRQPAAYVTAVEYGRGPGARPFIRATAEAEAGGFLRRIQDAGKVLEREMNSRTSDNVGSRNF